jgi:serine/threonine-protein kinase
MFAILDIVISSKRILLILSQLMIAIYILHENRILHRDIKPQNIFIDINNNLKLGISSY